MKELNQSEVCNILNEIVEAEMAGVVRYAHSSLMVTGPYRIPIVQFLQEQANERHLKCFLKVLLNKIYLFSDQK